LGSPTRRIPTFTNVREPNTFTGAELEDARWFSRGEVAGAVAEDS